MDLRRTATAGGPRGMYILGRVLLFRVLESSGLIAEWISNGGLERDIAGLSTAAATLALDKAQLSANPIKHLDRVLTHLELADTSLKAAVTRNRSIRFAFHPVSRIADNFQLFQIRLMQSCCHAYLQQAEEAYYCLTLAEKCFAYSKLSVAESIAAIASTPIAAVSMWKDFATDKRTRDEDMPGAEDFEDRMKPYTEALRRNLDKQFSRDRLGRN